MTALQDRSGVRNAFWITNGTATVGPVDRELFLRGVSTGRVPDGCFVIGPGWSNWRPLTKVREVAALKRTNDDASHLHLLDLAADDGERQLAALAAMCAATRAEFALLYRTVGERSVTCAAHGPRMIERLGTILPARDPVDRYVRAGQRWVGGVGEGPLGETLLRRFGAERESLHGVAIVPIRQWGSVAAFVELGRSDHPFRAADAGVLAAISDRVTDSAAVQMS